MRSRVNRGPAAAGENRAAILAAARRLFAERGYGVPLSAIAVAAGVGQGVLYRHFPSRLELALAVFDEHFPRYAAIAAEPGPDAFVALWRRVVDNLIEGAVFVDMAIDAHRMSSEYDGLRRLLALMADPLARAAAAGRVAPDITVDEVVLAIRMAYGLVRTATEPDARDLRRTILGAFPRLGGAD